MRTCVTPGSENGGVQSSESISSLPSWVMEGGDGSMGTCSPTKGRDLCWGDTPGPASVLVQVRNQVGTQVRTQGRTQALQILAQVGLR